MTSHRRDAVRPTCEEQLAGSGRGRASGMDKVCERCLMIQVIRSRFQEAGKRPLRAAGPPISGRYAW